MTENTTLHPARGRASVGSWLRVGLLAVGHVFADGCCMVVAPLLAYMGRRLGVTDGWASALFAASAIGASLSQPVWGYVCERFGGRWVLILSPLMAAIVVDIALTHNYWLIFMMIVVGGVGTGAYHPVSGALAGRLAEPHRALGVALFIAAGMIGVAACPVLVTQIVDRGDLIDIWPIALPAPFLALMLWLAFRGDIVSRPTAGTRYSFRTIFGDHTTAIILLFITATMRTFPISAYQVAVPFMVAKRFDDVTVSGYIFGLFTAGLGGGGVIGSILAHRRDEKRLLVASLALCAPAVLTLSFASGWWLLPAAALAGGALGSTVPMAIAMGQRLAPQGAQMFSAMMMGLSWGLTGLLAPLIMPPLMDRWGYAWATAASSLALIPATIAAICLPRPTGLNRSV